MRYYLHWHNIRYAGIKRIEQVYMWLARHMPSELRMWVVVDSTIEARHLYPVPGYDGPDGLQYAEIFDGARRRHR